MFSTADCTPELWCHDGVAEAKTHLVTRVKNVRYLARDDVNLSPLNGYPDEGNMVPTDGLFWHRAMGTAVPLAEQDPSYNANDYAGFDQRNPKSDQLAFLCMPPPVQDTWWSDTGPFAARIAASTVVGPVFQSKIRVSQHMCAPVLNPNRRIGSSAPLNYDSAHLPPELRDFRLECRDVKWDFLPGTKTLESLVLYEFNGGNQSQEAASSLLHLPQFRTFQTSTATDGSFDFEVFSPYGMPSYVAVFARDADFSRDAERQPIVKQLSLMNNTTKKKSNTILEAREHELYHITQRNVHPRAEYDRIRYRHRQVVLLSAEDIGMMGIGEYQAMKRCQYRLSGVVDQTATVSALFVYNNRGLLVKGRTISVVRV